MTISDRRERDIYAQIKADNIRKTEELRAEAKAAKRPPPPAITTDPIDTIFFFPAKADSKAAKRWAGRLAGDPPIKRLLERVARREAMLKSDIMEVREFVDSREERLPDPDRQAVLADNARLDKEYPR